MDRNESALVETTDVRWPTFVAEGLAALAQADRVRLILALGDDELSANHLADIVALSPLAVRQHLAVLAFHGFVSSQRYGDRLFYRVSNPFVSQLVLSKLPSPPPGPTLQPIAPRRTSSQTPSAFCAGCSQGSRPYCRTS